MSKEIKLADVPKKAVMTDQLLNYVNVVAELKSKIVASCLVHFKEDTAFLVGYPLDGSIEPISAARLAKALSEITSDKELQRVIVVAPFRPAQAPEWAPSAGHNYLSIELPYDEKRPRGLGGLFAAKPRPTMPVDAETWSEEHAALAQRFAEQRNLNASSQQIFKNLETYLKNTPEAVLFCVRNQKGELLGCLVGDFTSESTAFYMLSFNEAKAGREALDSLMRALIAEAERRDKKRLLLGLDVDRNLTRDYKDKWGAQNLMPMVQTSWELNESGKAQARYYKQEMGRRAEAERNAPLLVKIKRWIGL